MEAMPVGMGFNPILVLVMFSTGVISVLLSNIIVDGDGRLVHISGQFILGVVLILLSVWKGVMLFV